MSISFIKKLFERLNPERGFVAEEIEWEGVDGFVDTALKITCKKINGEFIVENPEQDSGDYVIYETYFTSDGKSYEKLIKTPDFFNRIRNPYAVVSEIAGFFARNDIDEELAKLEKDIA